MSKFVQNNYGNASGVQFVPRGREADFVQNGENARRVIIEPGESVTMQTVNNGEIKFQSLSSGATSTNASNATFVQNVYGGGIGFQAQTMKTTYK